MLPKRRLTRNSRAAPSGAPERFSRKTAAWVGGATLLLLAGATVGLLYWGPEKKPALLPPDATFEQIREIEGNLAEEDRPRFRAEMNQRRQRDRARMEAEMFQRAEAFNKLTTVDERNAFLDRIIDEGRQRMTEMRERGPRNRPEGTPPRERPRREGVANAGGGNEGPGVGRRRGPPSEERGNQMLRERLDASTPGQRAQMQQLWMAMQERRQARGLSGPGGPRGPGGPGGRPGR